MKVTFIQFTVLLVLLVANPLNALNAQETNRVTIKGIVVDDHYKPLPFTNIALNDGEIGTTSNSKGEFTLSNINIGEYTYHVSLLGYNSQSGTLSIDTNSQYIEFMLEDLSLNLDAVVVTAQRTDIGSRAVINEEAILHVQPKSLVDILQLLPGGLTTNPSLNDLGQVSLREIDGSENNALGAAVILDGAQLSNDANLQSISFTKSYNNTGTTSMDDQTTANKGVDLRSISAENIESVEVIRGIPSAEYGNLTSGVVIVNTKSGVTPLELKAKTDAFSKLFYAGKGFVVGQGAMNLGMDYSQSYSDPRKKYKGYERLTAQLGYSTIFNNHEGQKPITFNLKSSFHQNINSVKDDDPQLAELQQTYRNESMGAMVTVNGAITLNSWITKLDYNLSAQVTKTDDYSDKYIYTPDQVITDSRESGTFVAKFNDTPYSSQYSINGLPINLAAQVKANKYVQTGTSSYLNFKTGIDYKYDVNKGAGLVFDIDSPPQALGTQTLRPRAYSSIPALKNLSYFFENNGHIAMGSTALKTNIGVRVNALFLNEEQSGRNSIYTVEPRANIAYVLVNKPKESALEYLSILGGFGISNKMPTLLSLYPDYAYFDYQNLAYKSNTSDAELALMTTNVITDTTNPDLKPTTNTKWELGINFTLWGVKGSVTYYNEKNINEFGYSSQLVLSQYKLYSIPAGATNLNYDSNNDKVTYTYNGEDNLVASYENKCYFDTWAMPSNSSASYKHGVEYTLDLGQFKPLRTSLYVDGAWFYIKRVNTQDYQSTLYDDSYAYAPVRPAGQGTIRQRINTNLRFITHIPKIGMVFTTTMQIVWNEKSQSFYEDEQGKPLYTLNSDGDYFLTTPIGFYDKEGNYTVWQSEFTDDVVYGRMNDYAQLYAYKEDSIAPWMILNIRLTKEFRKFGELSIIANNFLAKTVWHTNENTLSQSQLSPSTYVGAELKINIW